MASSDTMQAHFKVMLWSSERRSGLYIELSLTIHKVTKLIKIPSASMMIKLSLSELSPMMIYTNNIQTTFN